MDEPDPAPDPPDRRLPLHLHAFFALLGGLPGAALLTAVGGVAGGFGIANDRKWGYNVGLAVAFLPSAHNGMATGGPSW